MILLPTCSIGLVSELVPCILTGKRLPTFLARFYFPFIVSCLRSQDYREKTLAAFKEGSMPVLIATDVASR